MNKKGFVGLWADVGKGLIWGFAIGVVLTVLTALGIIPLPFGLNLCGC